MLKYLRKNLHSWTVGSCHNQQIKICKSCSSIFKARFLNRLIHHNSQHISKPHLLISKNVAKALKLRTAVVALESTIITHGMPYPKNLETALEVEEIIRQNDATPATIGIVDGNIHVGLEHHLIEQLAQEKNAHKVSRRDLAVAVAKHLSGGTTVSATMLIAKWSGIKVFVTGGIGGVHRSGENTLDISADLRELGRTPVMVVSAGVKSILDIGRTLEYLETEGVTVATYGSSKDFPAFFTQSSGHPSPYNVCDVNEATALLAAHSELNMDSGMLLAVPIPNEYTDMGDTIDNAINEALEESYSRNTTGKDVTPFVLQRVNELTSGLSLKANILLIKNNAEIGAKIAKCFSSLTTNTRKQSCNINRNVPSNAIGDSMDSKRGEWDQQTVVIGGSNIDIVSKSVNKLQFGGASNPAAVSQTLGGVGRNMAEVLWRLNCSPFLVSAVGGDYHGKTLLNEIKQLGAGGVASIEDGRTGVYNVVFDVDGEVSMAVMDGDIHDKIVPDLVLKHQDKIVQSSLVCVDANIPRETMRSVCSLCSRYDIPLLYEPTGVLIAAKGYQAKSPFDYAITYMTPSLSELIAIYESVTGKNAEISNFESLPQCDDSFLRRLARICNALLPFTPCILVTLGNQGVFSACSVGGKYHYTHYSLDSPPSWSWLDEPVANVSGSGDSFAAGFAFGILRHSEDIDKSVRIGISVAQRTLRSPRSVSLDITDKDAFVSENDWKGRTLVIDG